MKRFLAAALLLLTGWLPVRAADPAANKALFDRTVDRLNFQTMEGVYDARFTRKKLPITLLTRDERRGFKDFNGDAAFEKLFHNYNDEAEKYKNRFPGAGPATMASFEKGLRGILLDANFEFLLAKAARREDRAALIRRLEGTIKQAVAQYDASGEPASEARQPDTLAGARGNQDAAAAETPVAEAQVNDLNQSATPTPDAPAPVAAPTKSGGWGDMLPLMLAFAALAGVVYLLFVVVPALRAQVQRGDDSDDFSGVLASAAPDDHLPPTMAEEARHRAVELRFELLADEVDELKGRIRELETRLADALAAPPEDDVFAPAPEPAPIPAAPAVEHYPEPFVAQPVVQPMAQPMAQTMTQPMAQPMAQHIATFTDQPVEAPRAEEL